MESAVIPFAVAWGVSSRAAPGESESGDQFLVRESPSGLFLAVVDALGHGAEAARTARRALELLEPQVPEEPLEAVARRCHVELRPTRGAAIALARLDWHRRTGHWIAIGNVAGAWDEWPGTGAARNLHAHAGVVGDRLPSLRVQEFRIGRGGVLALATDGIDADFASSISVSCEPRSAAEGMVARYASGRDDALALVVRCMAVP